MKNCRVHFQWVKEKAGIFRTAVSLHSHTLHSRESLDFIQRATKTRRGSGAQFANRRTKYRASKAATSI